MEVAHIHHRPDAFYGVEDDPTLHGVDVMTDVSMAPTAFTRYTAAPTAISKASKYATLVTLLDFFLMSPSSFHQSRRSSRSKRKMERKIGSGRKGTIDEEEYVSSFKVELMDAVIQWCRGASFSEICKITDQLFEGSLIRVFRRLGELLRQMAMAAQVIGNTELKEKFEKALEMLERPNSVIFCSSLYL